MSSLALFTLGDLRVEVGERPLEKFRTNRVPALLIYLAVEAALHGPTPHSREKVMTLLWPDILEKSARANLRQALYLLRQIIPELDITNEEKAGQAPFILSDYQTVQINPDVDVAHDLALFGQLLSEVRAHDHPDLILCASCQQLLEQAVSLYRGPFLADFSLPDCNAFEQWATTIREKVRRQVLDALDTLTLNHLRQGGYHQAEGYAREQLAIDNLRESAYRQLMETLARNGQRAAAQAEYETCRRLLAAELGMAPTGSTTALNEKIQNDELDLPTGIAHDMRGYELHEQLGFGRDFAVYRAYQPVIGREVAIKVIQPQFANRPDFIRRFEQEGRLIAQLEHPHIVPLYDYWRGPQGAYLVTRLYRGGSLADSLAAGAWTLATAVRLVDQIAAALAAAHLQSIVHRDVKPEIILLDEAGNAYLSDFGIAKEITGGIEPQTTADLTGTAEYASPEQVRNDSATPLSDQYSFGLVIYRLLTGQHPWPGLSLAAMLNHHLHKTIPTVSDQRADCPPPVDAVLHRATAKQPADRYPDILTLANALRQALGHEEAQFRQPEPASPPTFEIDTPNPYKGLRAFQEADAPFFFGRQTLIQRLVKRLAPPNGQFMPGRTSPHTLADGRFLAVVGPSGSGKSSVVKAGLMPALRQGALPGSEKWFIVEMTPGTHPLEDLELVLLRIAVNPPPSLLEPLQKDERGLLRVLRRVLPVGANGEPGVILLFIDQFEELYTQVVDPQERKQFLDNLLTAINEPQGQLRVVITLRADFYDRPLQTKQLGALLQQYTELVLPLTAEELERVVCRPAAKVGLTVEPGVLTAVTSAVQEQPGALPLIQYALTELFERRQALKMTASAYEEIGGVTGALSRRAEALYAALDETGQEAARQIFLRLVAVGEGVDDTRRRVTLAELASLISDETGDNATHRGGISPIIEAYGRSRLLTFDKDSLTRMPTVEVAHEALLREWPRLRNWLDAYRDDMRLQRSLATAVMEWTQAEHDSSYLLRGARLTQFAEWAETSRVALTAQERQLLTTSLDARQTRQQAEESRRQRELEAAQQLAATEQARANEQNLAAQRLRKRAFMLAGMLGIALLLAIATAIFGQQARQNAALYASERDTAQTEAHIRATAEMVARQESALATARELSMAAVNNLNDDPELSILLALESLASTYTVEAENTLHWAVQDSRVRLQIGDRLAAFNKVAFHPQGSSFATAGADGEARVWDTVTGELLWDLTGHTDFVQDLNYSPDGTYLATAGNDLTARVWDLRTGENILTLRHPDAVDDVDFSPDGTTLATASYNGGARLWNVETGDLERVLSVTDCIDVTFSPDGTLLATTSLDSTAQIWDLSTDTKRHTLRGHTDWVLVAEFSPDGRYLATAGMDIGPLIWDVETGELIVTPKDGAMAPDIAYSPDGERIAVAYTDGNVDVWDLAIFMENSAAAPVLELTGHANMVSGVAFSPNSHLLATAGNDGTARIWDVSTSGETETFVHENITEGAAFSPDGRYLAIGVYGTGDVILWDVIAGAPAITLNQGAGDFWEVAFSPDGKQVAAAFNDGTVAVWDISDPDQVLFKHAAHYAERAFASGATGIAYSPNGQWLASTGENGSVFIWDTHTGAKRLAVSGHGPSATPGIFEGIFSVAFSPDGNELATSGADGVIKLWDVSVLNAGAETTQFISAGEELFSLSGHEATALDVDFSPDGRLLVSADFNGLAIVWDLASRAPLFRIESADSIVSDIDFSPDGRLLALASHDGLARVWDVEKQQEWLQLYRAGSSGVCEVAFFPDSAQLVATGCRDREARFFTLNLDDLVSLAHSRLTRGLTDQECGQYLHQDSCP